jgi:hypothetical protein
MFPGSPADMVPPNHSGVDGYSNGYTENGITYNAYSVPIYALEDGVVIEATKDDGKTSGKYIWGLYAGIAAAIHVDSIKQHKIVYAMEHFSGLDVGVGSRVQRGVPFARQGSTGDSSGPHCHVKLFVDDQLVDITPFAVCLDPLQSAVKYLLDVYADPIPQEDTNMGTLPQPITYIYKDDSNQPLVCRTEPGLDAPKNGQSFAQGEVFDATAVQDKDGHSWAQTAKGWASMGTPSGYWVTPAAGDTSALEEQLDSLEATVQDQANEIIALEATVQDQANEIIALEHNLGLSQAEVGRLGGIIDTSAASLAQK